jgi:hypothetical protein
MAPEEWLEMISVETGNVGDNAVHLAAGGTHKLKASMRVDQFVDHELCTGP